MTQGPIYSIIIPHYNTPELLMRCLHSVPVREEIQVIVVDDNSPESATYLTHYPELERPHLEFVQTFEGKGAGYARNVGMLRARGEWLIFADSDDFFVENMFEVISEYANSPADVVYFRKDSVDSDDVHVKVSRSENINILIDYYLKTGDDKRIRTQFSNPVCKMIKNSFVRANGFKFSEVKYANDVLFSTLVGCHANLIDASGKCVYVIASRQGSLIDAYCTKPGELETRSEEQFKAQTVMREAGIVYEGMGVAMMRLLVKMLKKDRKLFRSYYWRLDQIYPSRVIALRDLTVGSSVKIKASFYLYAVLLEMAGFLRIKI